MITPKFYYKQEVNIIGGFYRKSTGTIHEMKEVPGRRFWQKPTLTYKVYLKTDVYSSMPMIDISEIHLEAKYCPVEEQLNDPSPSHQTAVPGWGSALTSGLAQALWGQAGLTQPQMQSQANAIQQQLQQTQSHGAVGINSSGKP